MTSAEPGAGTGWPAVTVQVPPPGRTYTRRMADGSADPDTLIVIGTVACGPGEKAGALTVLAWAASAVPSDAATSVRLSTADRPRFVGIQRG